jgi:hypothetical protein
MSSSIAIKGLFAGAAFQTGIPFNVTFQSDLSKAGERWTTRIGSFQYSVPNSSGRVLSPEDKPGNAPGSYQRRFWRSS